jgi:hypothetical protein
LVLLLLLLLLLLVVGGERNAYAAAGPGCDAGPCADNDGDGFISCACAPPGQTCDCDDNDPKAYPGAPEACNADKDFACNGPGSVGDDAGSKCVFGYGCLGDLCVPRCRPLDDFGCDNGSSCIRNEPTNERLCKPSDCTAFGCPPGFTCDDAKNCVPNCAPDVKCPYGQRCRGFACIDNCAGVSCAVGAVCNSKDGRCVPSCGCSGATCAANETCDLLDASVPSCIETACIGVTCPEGQHCLGGTCIDDCKDVVCPPERLCRVISRNGNRARGECIDLCNPDPCQGTPNTCEWRDGGCVPPSVDEGGLVSTTNRNASDINFVGGGGGGASCSGSRDSPPSRSLSAVGIGISTLVTCAWLLRKRRRK